MFYDANEAETEVGNVDIERMLWLPHRVNVFVDVSSLNCFPVAGYCAYSYATPHAAAATATEGPRPVSWTADATAALAVVGVEVWSELHGLDPCHD